MDRAIFQNSMTRRASPAAKWVGGYSGTVRENLLVGHNCRINLRLRAHPNGRRGPILEMALEYFFDRGVVVPVYDPVRRRRWKRLPRPLVYMAEIAVRHRTQGGAA